MNNKKTGGAFEKYAATYLEASGYSIIELNFRTRFGEIDIVAKDGEFLVFVEVKYRKTKDSGYPEESVSLNKQIKISKVADYYRITHHIKDDTPVRFDVVSILDKEVKLYKNAFEYICS